MAAQEETKNTSKFLVGSCLGMCPYAEQRLRQRERLIHPLEMAVDSNGGRLNYVQMRAMVKEFSRSAAGHEIKASDIRPLPVLVKTVKYLLMSACCRQDVSWALVYQFVSDRLHAVRQDLCVQGVKNDMSIQVYQAAVRFYVYAHYRTCEHGLSDFDPYLNKKHLTETLTLVISLFQDQDKDKKEPCVDTKRFGDAMSVCSSSDEDDDEEARDNPDDKEDANESKIVQDTKTSEKDNVSGRTESNVTNLRNPEVSHIRDEDPGDEDTETARDLNEDEDWRNLSDMSRRTTVPREGRRGESRNVVITDYTLREEAEALYLLVNFGNEEALLHVLELPKHIRFSQLVSIVTEMNFAWLTRNYCRVLRLAAFLPPLFLCAFHPHLTMIQKTALGILSRAHSSKGLVYRQDDLAAILLIPSSQDLADACRHYGLTVMKLSRVKWVDDKLNTIQLPELLLPAGRSP
ncbi:SAC3 family protein C-like [Homarus americanus]|uniref:SAC3 family protein C-like n=1 Tax=Homarus americanus TaxID=6706 RepID=A0A8J5NBB0_HOMAM|nr:SAC3 family protein C-like [Homarus americanus]